MAAFIVATLFLAGLAATQVVDNPPVNLSGGQGQPVTCTGGSLGTVPITSGVDVQCNATTTTTQPTTTTAAPTTTTTVVPVGISAVGSLSSSQNGDIQSGNYAVADSPLNVGDLMVLTVTTNNSTPPTVSSVTGGDVATWKLATSYNDNNAVDQDNEVWYGVTTSTGPATITAHVSGYSNSTGLTAQEFTAGAGASWEVDKSGDVPTDGSSFNFPSLAPASPGELYYGLASTNNNGVISGGATAGVVYEQLTSGFVNGQFVLYDSDVTAALAPAVTENGENATDVLGVLFSAGTTSVTTTTTAAATTTTVATTTPTTAPTTSTSSGTTTTTVLGNQPPFLTSVSPNGRYALDQYGHPFLINGDSAWDLAWALSASDQATYLANREANGFNAVVTDLVGSSGVMDGNSDGADYAGIVPFTGSNFTPNPSYWSKITTFFGEAEQDGITVFALPIDAYATASGQPFANMTTVQAQAFGTWLSQNYPQSQFPNIVWMEGNDYDGDGIGCCNGGFVSQYQSLITGFRIAGDTRPVTIEQGFYESLSTDGANLGPLMTLNAAYNYHPTYSDVLRGYATEDIPVFFFEGAYENATTGFPATPLDIRKEIDWSLTSGATGTFYGNDSLWQFGPGWQNQLSTPDVGQREAVDSVFAGINWWTLQPDVNNQLVTSGRNRQYTGDNVGSSTPYTNDSKYGNYVTAAYSPSGSLAVIYNPDTSVNHITISSAVLGSNPTITAVDPTDGATTNLGWTTTPTMGANAGGDNDWLFIITAG